MAPKQHRSSSNDWPDLRYSDWADTCATLLEMSGYDVRVAYTPDAALAMLAEFQPDVAILDIGLPGVSGYELARTMKRQGYAGRLLALTGYGQSADMAASAFWNCRSMFLFRSRRGIGRN